MTGSTREQEPNLHEVRETSVLTLYGVSTYTFAVAPSRARGLKRLCFAMDSLISRRALTGAWIETPGDQWKLAEISCRALTGAWIETMVCRLTRVLGMSRPHGRVD